MVIVIPKPKKNGKSEKFCSRDINFDFGKCDTFSSVDMVVCCKALELLKCKKRRAKKTAATTFAFTLVNATRVALLTVSHIVKYRSRPGVWSGWARLGACWQRNSVTKPMEPKKKLCGGENINFYFGRCGAIYSANIVACCKVQYLS